MKKVFSRSKPQGAHPQNAGPVPQNIGGQQYMPQGYGYDTVQPDPYQQVQVPPAAEPPYQPAQMPTPVPPQQGYYQQPAGMQQGHPHPAPTVPAHREPAPAEVSGKKFFSFKSRSQKTSGRDENRQDQWLPTAKSSAVNRAGTRLISVGIYGTIVLGLALGGMSYLALDDLNTRVSQQKPVAATSLDLTDTSAQAQAVGYVQAWLSATGSDHAALDQYAQVTVSSQEPTEYRNLRQAGFTKNGDLISVRVTGETKSVTAPQQGDKPVEVWTPRWWQVVVRVDNSGGISVVGLPTPIAAPASASGNLNLGYSKPVNSQEASATVSEFLQAYLTGVGEVSRYTTPGSSILPVTPAPYEQVSVQEIRSDVDLTDKTIRKNGAKAHLSVVARTSSGKSAQTTTYFLTVKARDGRWEIESIDQTPLLQPSEGDKK